jgi:AcrR family transcriptional regulator
MANATSPMLERSFIETHRRQQIIEAAVEIIATQGFHQATIGNIAKAAGISKGVIGYYFANKDELIHEITAYLLDEMRGFIFSQVDKEQTVLDKLKSYITASLEFVRQNRDKFLASAELMTSLHLTSAEGLFGANTYVLSRGAIARILEQGDAGREFPNLDTVNLAAIIQGAVDGLSLQWVSDPERVDLDQSRETLLRILETYFQGIK